MSAQCSPKNPFRPVHWRWERAEAIADGKASSSRRLDDESIRRATRFRRRELKCKTAADEAELVESDEALYFAKKIYSQKRTNGTDAIVAHALEARILAGQTPAEIAAKGVVDADVVTAYGDCFFDVAHRLDQPDYIMFAAIEPAIYSGLRDRRQDLLWKLFAYKGGPVILDVILTFSNRPMMPRDVSEVEAYFHADIKTQLQRKAVIAAHVVPLNDMNTMLILDQYQKLVELDRAVHGDTGGGDHLAANVKAVFMAMPFVMSDGETAGGLLPTDGTAVELRGDEIISLSLGRTIPTIDADAYDYPPIVIDVTATDGVSRS